MHHLGLQLGPPQLFILISQVVEGMGGEGMAGLLSLLVRKEGLGSEVGVGLLTDRSQKGGGGRRRGEGHSQRGQRYRDGERSPWSVHLKQI